MEKFNYFLFFRRFLTQNIAQNIGIATMELQPIWHVPGTTSTIPKPNGVIFQKKFIVEKETVMVDPVNKIQIQFVILIANLMDFLPILKIVPNMSFAEMASLIAICAEHVSYSDYFVCLVKLTNNWK